MAKKKPRKIRTIQGVRRKQYTANQRRKAKNIDANIAKHKKRAAEALKKANASLALSTNVRILADRDFAGQAGVVTLHDVRTSGYLDELNGDSPKWSELEDVILDDDAYFNMDFRYALYGDPTYERWAEKICTAYGLPSYDDWKDDLEAELAQMTDWDTYHKYMAEYSSQIQQMNVYKQMKEKLIQSTIV